MIQCPVCMKPVFDVSWGMVDPGPWKMCDKDQKHFDDGLIALIETDVMTHDEQRGVYMLKTGEAVRTGKVVHVRREIADDLFRIEINKKLILMFVEPGIEDQIKKMLEEKAKLQLIAN